MHIFWGWVKYGPRGRDWPAMSVDYGYHHGHALCFCFETPSIVEKSKGTRITASAKRADSAVCKLLKLCELGGTRRPGMPWTGFPVNPIAQSPGAGTGEPVLLFAWDANGSVEERKQARFALWQRRRSLQFLKTETTGKTFRAHLHWAAARSAKRPCGSNSHRDGIPSRPLWKRPAISGFPKLVMGLYDSPLRTYVAVSPCTKRRLNLSREEGRSGLFKRTRKSMEKKCATKWSASVGPAVGTNSSSHTESPS